MSEAKQKENIFVRIVRYLFPRKDDVRVEKIRKIVFLTAAVILIVSVSMILIGTAQSAGANSPDQQLADQLQGAANTDNNAQIIHLTNSVPPVSSVNESTTTSSEADSSASDETSEGEPEPIDLTPVVNTPLNVNFDYLQSLNPDTRAWIKITGTLLNSEVLQSTYDFDYYIDHDFYGNYNEYSPCIFSSDINRWDGSDDNLILFSHKLNSGYGFGSVVYYVPNDGSSEPLAFYKKHPTILFQRPGGPSETYKIFAGIVANTDPQYGEVFEYISKIYFYGVDDFNSYMKELLDRSWFYTDVDLQYGDKFLTLSTCYWPINRSIPTRWVLFARKVRPGESEYVDTSVARRNWNPKMFEYYYQVFGGQWYGSTWDTSKLLS